MQCSFLSVLNCCITKGRIEISSNVLHRFFFGSRLPVTELKRHCSSVRMVRVLNVAEKNDAAKNLSEIMSRGNYTRREGRSKFNKIYQFDYHLFNEPCNMVMTSVSGHLLDLEFAGAYRSWRACNPVALFEAPILKFCPNNFLNIKQTLEEEASRCSKLVIWTDGDREGENIGFEIIDVCKKVKPNLPIYRARFSEITQQAVARACQNLRAPDEKTSDAVYVRRELDLRIGAAFTRFQTLRLQRVFPDVLADQLISYGSCQFPTLGFVVERYKQAQNFIPEPFWKIKVLHKKKDISAEFSWKRNRLFEQLACLVLHQKCIEEPEATVTAVKNKSKSKWRPLPLDTVEMEKSASRKLRINAKETMTIAEKLYTQGLISYPRTETNIFPKDINLQALVQEQTQDPRWGEFAAGVIADGPNPRQGTKTDNAHPPIHPIKHTPGLEGNARTLYEFIVRHFLACVSKDAEGFETTVDIKIAEEEFTTSGLVILARNYLDVYPYEKWSAKEIPEYENGERFMPESIEMVSGETTAPLLLTESDLIALMDKHGIGTDATHADHIETIKSRLYVGLNNENRFIPGELGMGLVEGYDRMGFEMSKPALRSELESDLKRICEGTKNHQVVLQEQIVKYKEVFVEAVNQANRIDEALAQYFGNAQQIAPNEAPEEAPHMPIMKCVQCGNSEVILRRKRQGEGFYLSCMAFPACKSSIWFPESVAEVSVHDAVCTECRPGPIKKLSFKFKRGSYAPLLPDEVVRCIGGCDDAFMDILGIRPISRAANNNNPRGQFMGDLQGGGDNRNRIPNAPANNRNATSQIRNNTVRPPARPTGENANPNANNPTDNVECGCGQPASLLTVRKEGPNNGRQFYGCPRRDGRDCKLFQWADAAPPVPPPPNNRIQAGHNPPPANDGVNCNCANAAKILTVMKEGPNKGRPFYSCNKPRDQSCGFFQWADDLGAGGNPPPRANNNNNQGQNRWNGGHGNDAGPANNPWNNNRYTPNANNGGPAKRPKTGSNATTITKRRPGKCSICGLEGHNRKSCPQK